MMRCMVNYGLKLEKTLFWWLISRKSIGHRFSPIYLHARCQLELLPLEKKWGLRKAFEFFQTCAKDALPVANDDVHYWLD